MNLTGNTILITGGGSGIGLGLAAALHARGNQVIITGRRRAVLEAAAAEHPGMAFAMLDVRDAAAIRAFAARLIENYPSLNVLINNAGVMPIEDLLADPIDLDACEETIATNLLGPIRLTAALLPHLRRQTGATVINVSSGLAFVPLAAAPTYSATKAAVHSYSQSLRAQLRDTGVQVIELAPPLVVTGLSPGDAANPRALPLSDFISESVALLSAHPEAEEICVERVKLHRNAEAEGRYGAVFDLINPRRARPA